MQQPNEFKRLLQPKAGHCDICGKEALLAFTDTTSGLSFGRCCLECMGVAHAVLCECVKHGVFAHPGLNHR